MEKFATGVVRTAEFVQGRIATWESRRKSGDPFCGFAIRTREGKFVGHIVLGHGEKAGHAELAYLIRADYWNKGYGTEAANGIVNGLAPLLKTYNFKMRKEEPESTGEKRISAEGIQVIDATARPDNPASGAILRRLGFNETGIQDAHGAPREHFSGQVPCASSDSAWAILVMPGLTVFKD
jgi:RimJ/RimL family protein N-acetyltransferase